MPASYRTPRPAANKGTSVTKMIEQLATELVKTMPRVFNNVPVKNIRWYTRCMSYGDPIVSRAIDRVKMNYTPDNGFSNPEWSPVWQHRHGTTI